MLDVEEKIIEDYFAPIGVKKYGVIKLKPSPKLKTSLKFTQIKPYKINVYKAFLLYKNSINFI